VLGAQFAVADGLRRELNDLTLSWETAQPQQEKARAMIEGFRVQGEIRKEMEGWAQSRLAWHEQLIGLLEITPENIQLQSLSINQVLRLFEESSPARYISMRLDGRAIGTEAERSVRALEQSLSTAPAYTSLIAKVSVPQYGADQSPGAKKEDRSFQIACEYAERQFEANETTRRQKRKN
ncbi:MAG: hypothetical protein O3A51_09635, partial [Verrucomicrobia bacterium]|nr:hypothetical protein [Verrucomicrobiota bacterium]